MSDNILESYFVKISALPDATSFLKLHSVLKDTDTSIKGLLTGTLKGLAKFEIASIGLFSAVGVGLVSLADKTAMTDQSYRIMGMRMLMTKESARAMQMALDELGATIDEVAYDPELNRRFQYLYELNMKMGKMLGGSFDRNMRSIRDLRMEYKMLGEEVRFVSMGAISTLFDKLGFGSEDLLNKMDQFNNWFMNNLPTIADEVSTYLVPVWKDVKVVIFDAGRELRTFAGDFTYLSGLLLGDKSIQTTEFSIHNAAKAFVDWMDVITEGALSFQLFGNITLHTIVSLSAAVAGYWAALKGNYEEASKYWNKAGQEKSAATRDVKDLFLGGSASDDWKKNPDLQGIMEHEQDKANRPKLPTTLDENGKPITRAKRTDDLLRFRHQDGAKRTDDLLWFRHQDGAKADQYSPTSSDKLSDMLNTFGKKYNLNPELLAAMMNEESGQNPGAISPKGAMGLMQLMPGTAKQYGATNPFNPEQNLDAGAHYMSDLLRQYHGDLRLALSAYNAGPENVEKYGGTPPFKETQDYVDRVIRQFQALSEMSQASGGQVIIDNINIHVPKDLPEGQWNQFVHDSMHDIISKNTKAMTAQTAGGAYW